MPTRRTAAAWLSRAGRSVILLERHQFPRFHIGESLLSSVNDALGAIGAASLVRKAGFPQKWGATFMMADGSNEKIHVFDRESLRTLAPLPPIDDITPEWAWSGSTGRGVKVAPDVELVEVYKALGDETRLRILRLMSSGITKSRPSRAARACPVR